VSQFPIRATYMRGGTSKGVFFVPSDLPPAATRDAALRDRLLLRVVGSPDPYGKHIDGMGGATSSTSKVVLVSRSERPDCDVDYLFGAVDIERPLIDWSGNCGNLSTAVGPFAIARGLVDAPPDGLATVRIWQANIGKRIVATVPMRAGEVVETGAFEVDGVAFPAAEIALEFLDPAGGEDDAGAMFPSGQACETLQVPGVGALEATLINAGNPTVFVRADAIGLAGTELQPDVNGDAALLARLETIRAHAAVAMGLAATAQQATAERPATPKLAFVAAPRAYVASSGREVTAADHDLSVRILSMGKLHHALTGTGGVAIAAAAAIPGTVISRVLAGGPRGKVRVGHPSGILQVGAEVRGSGKDAVVDVVRLSRTARRLMDGFVLVPPDFA
jgi:probable AcnD-accessory protein PrpF